MFLNVNECMDDFTEIVISVQKVRSNQYITIVSGLPDDLDLPRILKHIRRQLGCNGYIKNDTIVFTGDHKIDVSTFLVTNEICKESEVTFMGI